MKILCLGHLTYDTTLPVDFYPEENEKYHIGKKIPCRYRIEDPGGFWGELWIRKKK